MNYLPEVELFRFGFNRKCSSVQFMDTLFMFRDKELNNLSIISHVPKKDILTGRFFPSFYMYCYLYVQANAENR